MKLSDLEYEFNKVFDQHREPRNRFERRYMNFEALRMFKQVVKFTDAFMQQNSAILDITNDEQYKVMYSEMVRIYNAAFMEAVKLTHLNEKPKFVTIKPDYFYDTFKPTTE
jgi:hypothetical protein